MSNLNAVLMAALLSISAWSEATSPVDNHSSRTTTNPIPQRSSVIFQDPLLGSVKMRPVYTPRVQFGAASKPAPDSRFATVQRPAVSVAQITAVRPGSWR